MMPEPAIVGASIARTFDGERIEMYFVRDDGSCELLWQYEGLGDPTGRRRYLSVVLAEDEARAIFERDAAKEWILEPIHASIEGRPAQVVQNALEGGDLLGGADITITGSGSEDAFLDDLEAVEVWTVGDYKRELKLARASISENARKVDELLAMPRLWSRPVLLVEVLKLRSHIRKQRRQVERRLGEQRRAQERGRSERRTALLHAV